MPLLLRLPCVARLPWLHRTQREGRRRRGLGRGEAGDSGSPAPLALWPLGRHGRKGHLLKQFELFNLALPACCHIVVKLLVGFCRHIGDGADVVGRSLWKGD